MRILVTNDDGINAPGLKLLAQKAKKYGEIIIVAPKIEQSGKSHSINFRQGLMYEKVENLIENVDAYFVDSTPADCVRFANYYLKDDFDIVFSGINNGYNLGEDIIYSGTVAGASESVFAGKKGIAFSTAYNHLSEIDKRFDDIMDYLFKHKLIDKSRLLNINVPLETKGIRITHQGSTHFDTRFELNNDLVFQRGKPDFAKDYQQIKSDVTAIYNNYISITPLTVDRTDLKTLEKIIN